MIDLKRIEVSKFIKKRQIQDSLIGGTAVVGYVLFRVLEYPFAWAWLFLAVPFCFMVFVLELFQNVMLKDASATHVTDFYDNDHWHLKKCCHLHDEEDHDSIRDCYESDPADGCEFDNDDEDENGEVTGEAKLH